MLASTQVYNKVCKLELGPVISSDFVADVTAGLKGEENKQSAGEVHGVYHSWCCKAEAVSLA